MATAQFDSVERALWTAFRSLEERVVLLRKLAAQARRRGHEAIATMFDERSRKIDGDARAIHEVIVTGRALAPLGEGM